jgi:hypothetical protein
LKYSNIDILDYTKKFHDFEEKENLFNLSEHDLLYWDVIRYHVFYNIYFKLNNIKLSTQNNQRKKARFTSKIYHIFKFYFYTFFKTTDYLFFTASRNINKDGLVYDINLEEIIENTPSKKLIIETYPLSNTPLKYNCIFNYGLVINLFINNKFNLSKNKIFNLNSLIEKLIVEFDVEIITTEFNVYINNFFIEYNYYKNLFKKLKPKTIFLTQNGTLRGLFFAAKELKITTVEMQHGLLGFYHPSYSYPQFIAQNSLKTVPDYFFSYGTHWTNNLNYPVIQSLPIGNSIMAKKVEKGDAKYDIVILYSDGYYAFLNLLLEEFNTMQLEYNLCIKLHPSLFSKYAEIAAHFSENPKIEVIKNELSVDQLFGITKTVLAIQSTSVYQALHNNIPVFIYKRVDYKIHEDVFSNENVILVDSGKDIEDFFESKNLLKTKTSNADYFHNFNSQKFSAFIQNH